MSRRQSLLTTPQPQPVASCAAGVAAALLALIVVGCCERSFAQFGCRQFDPAGPAVRGLLI